MYFMVNFPRLLKLNIILVNNTFLLQVSQKFNVEQ